MEQLIRGVPGFVAYPPELSYPAESRTTEPAIVVRQQGSSRLLYFPGDVERTWADLTRARAELDYSPATGFEEGLRRQWLAAGSD